MEAIARAVGESGRVAQLVLSSNKITDEGASALAEAVARSTALTWLNLSDNQITDVGASALAEAVARSSSLTTLDIYSIKITDVGASVLAEAVARSTSLTWLPQLQSDSGRGRFGASRDRGEEHVAHHAGPLLHPHHGRGRFCAGGGGGEERVAQRAGPQRQPDHGNWCVRSCQGTCAIMQARPPRWGESPHSSRQRSPRCRLRHHRGHASHLLAPHRRSNLPNKPHHHVAPLPPHRRW